MIKGIIRADGALQNTSEVLAEAELFGHVDGYPLMVLVQMLESWRMTKPSASQIASETWRRMVLERLIDFYAYPQARIPLIRGSLIHNGLQMVKPPASVKVVKEKRLKVAMPLRRDIVLSGQIDVFYPGPHRIEDYKTCMQIPTLIKPVHLLQLAIYTWLLRWAGYTVDVAVINYIAWDEMQQVAETKLTGKEVGPAISHPLFTDVEHFQTTVASGYDTLERGFEYGLIPPQSQCNIAWCRNCPLKWACDVIDEHGEVIDAADFTQEKYR